MTGKGLKVGWAGPGAEGQGGHSSAWLLAGQRGLCEHCAARAQGGEPLPSGKPSLMAVLEQTWGVRARAGGSLRALHKRGVTFGLGCRGGGEHCWTPGPGCPDPHIGCWGPEGRSLAQETSAWKHPAEWGGQGLSEGHCKRVFQPLVILQRSL